MRGDKKMKGWIPTTFLALVLLFGSTVAKADGIIIGGNLTDTEDPCTVSKKSLTGIIVTDLTGIIIGGNLVGTGIIVTDLVTKDAPVNCGIIIGGN
jgi:hypothetical protein